MKRPAVFFDRDNTLIVSDGYLGDPDKVALVEGAADAVAAVRAMGYATAVISNQSGVARGMFGEDAVRAVNARMDGLLQAANPQAIIDRHEFCPYHPQAKVEAYRQDSTLRKPRPGMIFVAADAMALDLPRSWVVGDAPRDIEAGKAAGCRTILVRDPKLTASPAADEPTGAQPDHVVASLSQAIEVIAGATQAVPEMSPPEDDQPLRIGPPQAEKHRAASAAPARSDGSLARLEHLAGEILREVRVGHEQGPPDFAVTKLLGGIAQVAVLAALFFAYLHRGDPQFLQALLTLALTLQTMTIALLLMGQRG